MRLPAFGQPQEVCRVLNKRQVKYTYTFETPGQYHWVAVLAPQNTRVIASWFTGWISIGGQIVLTASAAFAAGLQLQGLITLNHPDSYVPQRWQGMLFYWLVLVYAAAVNIWGSKILPHANLASGKWFGFVWKPLYLVYVDNLLQVSCISSASLPLWLCWEPCRPSTLRTMCL